MSDWPSKIVCVLAILWIGVSLFLIVYLILAFVKM